MTTMYKLADEYTTLIGLLSEAETEEEAAEICARIDALETDITIKAGNYARAIQQLEAEARAFAAEKTRLMACQRAAENSAARLKRLLADNLTRLEIRSIKTDIGTWRFQKNPPSCEVLDATAVPEEYHIPQPDKIDARAILAAYRETGEIPEGVDIRQGESLRFR